MVAVAAPRLCSRCHEPFAGRPTAYYCRRCEAERKRVTVARGWVTGATERRQVEARRWHREHWNERKVCVVCQVEKRLGDFYLSGQGRSAVRPTCAACVKDYQRAKQAGRIRSPGKRLHVPAGRCQCARPRAPGHDSCARCLWLDGWSRPSGVLIACLRDLGEQASAEALMVATTWSHRNVLRAAAELEAAGRLRRVLEDDCEDTGAPRSWFCLRGRMPDGWAPPRGVAA